MVEAARRFVETGEVGEVGASIQLDQVRGGGGVIPNDAPWQSVAAFAGEWEPALTHS